MQIHIRGSVVCSCLALVTLSAATAAAEETVGAKVTPGSPVSIFGNKGQIAISSEAGATFEHTSVSGVDGSTSTLVLRPGVDYFLIDRLSLGAFVGVDRQSTPAGSATAFRIGPRVGYDIAFSDHLSIWPRAGISYNSTTLKVDGTPVTPSAKTTNNAVAINLFVPLLFHTNHYFAGVGPALDTDLSGDAKATTFAVRVTLGGWIF